MEIKLFPKPKEISYYENIEGYNLAIKNVGNFKDNIVNRAKLISDGNRFNKEGTKEKDLLLVKDEKVDKGYELEIGESGIKITAADGENIMYGLVTLENLLPQMKDNFIKMSIKDWPSFKYRGIIEGFYGVPWSFEERKRLMIFGANLKNNVFIYAPKDDPFHRERWGDLYDEEKLEEIKQLAKIREETGNNFLWTIAPFYEQKINEENLKDSIDKILKKFEQLYLVGVRQFGVLGDDVGKLDARIPVSIMNEISAWRKQKGDVKEIFYCPASYTMTTFYDPRELNAYEMGFPEDVYLFHTGEKICSQVSKDEIDDYLTKDLPLDYEEGRERREPIFWLNYPVNDIDLNFRKIYLGPVDILDKDVEKLKGIVTNPMQEAEASLIAISAVSDYAWNAKDFDAYENYDWTIKQLANEVYDEFKIFASHMSNQDDRGIYGIKESEDLKEILTDESLESEVNLKEIRSKLESLRSVMEKLLNYEYNPRLKENIKPYVLNLKDKLLSAENYISAILWQEIDFEIAKSFFEEGENKRRDSYNYVMDIEPKGEKKLHAESATLIFNPWLNKLEKKAKEIFTNKNLLSERVFYSGLDGAKNYRIPLIYKTKEDTLLLLSDRRKNGSSDWGKIDLVLKRKEKDGNFSSSQSVIELADYPTSFMRPFTIDASVVQDLDTGRIFIFTTMFPGSRGFTDAEEGTGYIEVDGENRLCLYGKNGETFYIKDGKVFYLNGDETSYRVIMTDEEPFRQYGNIYQGDMIVGNIFNSDSMLKVKKTSFLICVYSDDDGKSWHGIKDLNSQIKREDMRFLGVSPSKGVYLKSGKIVFPAYFTNKYKKQSSCLVISDDHGKSFRLGAITNDGRIEEGRALDFTSDFNEIYQTGECSLTSPENGDLRLILRNVSRGLPYAFKYAVSKDEGESFEKHIKDLPFNAQSWCQCSSLNFTHENEEYLLISAPSSYGSFKRVNGKISLLKVKSDELKFIRDINLDRFTFGYSSLVKIDNNKFAVFYEKGLSASPDDVELIYQELEFKKLFEKKKEILNKYTIYPRPKKITYLDGKLELGSISFDKINSSSQLDEAVLQKIKEIEEKSSVILKNKKDTEKEKSTLKLYVDIDENENEYENAKNQYDYYSLEIDDSIKIKAFSQEGAFYALVTLEKILKESKDYILKLKIEDWASIKMRGIIEGYYGIPWGNRKRKALMGFTSHFKGNVFVFAPKDDPYHREKWRELYPKKELEEIEELAKHGEKIKVRYLWTISPFKKDSSPIDENNKEESIKLLIKKFEQLYKAGVRQFGILGDDVGALPRDVVVEVMKVASKWTKEKGDVGDLIFVPEGYVLAPWGFKPDELDQYSKEFPENVHIIFTGENTCAPLTQSAVDGFIGRETKIGKRRNPLFWLNWPVNDIDRTEYRRLFMGSANMLEAGVKNISGLLMNPLEEAFASEVAAFQVMDYAWNTEMFDAEKSWQASFKEIDSSTSQYLNEIARHMSNSDNGGIEGLGESEDIKLLNKKLEASLKDRGNYFLFYLLELQASYDKIELSVDSFLDNSEALDLKEEIRPYANNLKFKAKAAKKLIEAIKILKMAEESDRVKTEGVKKEIEKLLLEADKYLERAFKEKVHTRTAEFPAKELRAESGMHNINKNIEFMYKFLKEN